MHGFCTAALCILLFAVGNLTGAGQKPAQKSVEELAKSAGKSIVVVQFSGRDGRKKGLGSGFVVSKDGLIATNLHVIGQARPVTVQLPGGKEYPVKTVHASDRSLDLALLKIEAKDLPALELGDSDQLENGQAIVALGHPRGLKHSVVAGVVSGRPKIDGKRMIQIAIPIERGNSGGPVLDRSGRVLGIVTLKSQLTANLGFAVPINDLKKLLRRPNPIPMNRWVTIGRLNPDLWQTVFAGNWQQHNGRIVVDGPGEGFGGRSLCLSKAKTPKAPFEMAVTVRLDPESGAGGLAFHADGRNKHYGFYPSNGKLRLSRFEGPDVFSWTVLFEKNSKYYHPGEWNRLKVRVEKKRILCYVNGHKVIESKDDGLKEGKVGLVKFRTTHVQYKNFRVGKKLESMLPSPELTKKVAKLIAKAPLTIRPGAELVKSLVADAPASLHALRDRATLLEEKVKRLRELAAAVYRQKILDELAKAVRSKDDDIDLLTAGLLIAKLDNEELDVVSYARQVDRLAKNIRMTLPKKADEKARLQALNKELFDRRGFHGSRGDYYNRANSYLNQVLDDREGIPITLSVLYIELARRLGVKIAGVGLPGHFVVRHQPKKGEAYLIDVYEGGKEMPRAEAARKVRIITGGRLKESHLAPVSKKAILIRMLHNLAGIARDEEDLNGLDRYMSAILTIDPKLVEERLLRAAARYQLKDKAGAIADLDWLLENSPPGLNRERVMQLRRLLMKEG